MKKIVMTLLVLGLGGCVSREKYLKDTQTLKDMKEVEVGVCMQRAKDAKAEATVEADAAGYTRGWADADRRVLMPMAKGSPIEAIKIWLDLRERVYGIQMSAVEKKMWQQQLQNFHWVKLAPTPLPSAKKK